ncbi:Vps5 C terminal like-domain-containing protein [Umbelopsis sp. PMI_123]|nr:Vps5 C terminal like-domain-containing protein [Umbelopsis sp. PMI_123]
MASIHSEFLSLTLKRVDISRKDPLFIYQIETTLPTFQHKTSSGERTYSEFERLASHLTLLYEDLFVPALPDLSVSTVSGQRPEDEENVLIARIRRWVNRITTHPRFKASELVREFAESGQGFLPLDKPVSFHRQTSRFKQLKGGFGLGGSAPAEADEDFMTFTNQIQSFSQGLQTASKALHANFKCRKALSSAYLEMATKLSTLSEKELDAALQNAYRGLANVVQECGELQRPQAQSENTVIGDMIAYQIKNTQSAKDCLDARLSGIAQHLEAVKNTESKYKTMNKLKASSSIKAERVNEAIEDMHEAKAQEQDILRRCEKVNKNLKRDLSTNYKIQLTDDVTSAITEYVKAQIQFEKQHLKKWESLRSKHDTFTGDQSGRKRTGSIGRTDERRAAQMLSLP